MYRRQTSRVGFGCRLAVLFLWLGLSAVSLQALGERPLTAAERQAVALAARYLDGGVDAWMFELATDSPLAAEGSDGARAAIAGRLASPVDAVWRLRTPAEIVDGRAIFTIDYPSGIDETLIMHLVEEGAGYRLHSLRVLAEPAASTDLTQVDEEADTASSSDTTSPAASSTGASSGASSWLDRLMADPSMRLAYGLGLLGLLLLLVGAVTRKRIAVLLGVAVIVGAVLVRQFVPGLTVDTQGGSDASIETIRLEALGELREAMTRVDDGDTTAPEAVRGEVAALWRAQHHLARFDVAAAEAALAEADSSLPLAHLLTARLHLERLESADARLAYERLFALDVVHDGLLLEAAQAYERLGFPSRAVEVYEELEAMGSREAAPAYALARAALARNRLDRAAPLFRAAWSLEPIPRAEMLGDPYLAYLMTEFDIEEKVALYSYEEPLLPCDQPAEPIDLPVSASAHRIGQLLVIELAGEARVEVPAGCGLAPSDATDYDGLAWQRRNDERALVGLDSLRVVLEGGRGFSRPHLRLRAEETAEALARRWRWRDLVSLTTGLGDHVATVSPDFVRLRALALARIDEDRGASALLAKLVKANEAAGRPDPATFLQLSELLRRLDEFDLSLRARARAQKHLPYTLDGSRAQLTLLEKELELSHDVTSTEHFDIHYPFARDPYFAEQLALILESERARLGRWLPLPTEGEIVVVELLSYQRFIDAFGGVHGVVGLYDGHVRLPFAEVRTYIQPFVAIASHELAHALLSEITDDNAPAWFHEGLATHVQMFQSRANPLPDYLRRDENLSVSMIDAVLTGFASGELVPRAYDQAAWTVHFIESRWGEAGVKRLATAFTEGPDTDAAIQQAFGMTGSEFNDAFWRWGIEEAPRAWETEAFRYDEVFR